jgi:hypothetical protein
LYDKIKITHKREDSLLRIKDKVEQGKVTGYVIDKDNMLRYGNRLCVPDVDDLRLELMTEAHKTVYTMHPSSINMYQNLKVCY